MADLYDWTSNRILDKKGSFYYQKKNNEKHY